MEKKYVGQRMTRTEDPRLLTGQALFVDDVEIPGMLYAAFLRSDYAHGRGWWRFTPRRIWGTFGSMALRWFLLRTQSRE
jgi:hypothetical protein